MNEPRSFLVEDEKWRIPPSIIDVDNQKGSNKTDYITHQLQVYTEARCGSIITYK